MSDIAPVPSNLTGRVTATTSSEAVAVPLMLRLEPRACEFRTVNSRLGRRQSQINVYSETGLLPVGAPSAQSLKMFRRAGGFRESTGIGLARIGLGNLMVLSEWRRKMVRR